MDDKRDLVALLNRIALRLTGANITDLTTAERQIVDLLRGKGYLDFDDNNDVIYTPK